MPESRKRHRSKNHKRPPASNLTDPNQEILDIKQILKIQIANILLVLIIFSLSSLKGPTFREEFFQKVPIPLIVLYIIAFLLFTAKSTWVAVEYFFGGKRRNLPYLKRMLRRDLILSVFILAVAVFVQSYVYSVPKKLAEFISAHVPGIGDRLSSIVSFMATATISGVIGNFAYDLLKRIVRKMSRGKNPAKKKYQ